MSLHIISRPRGWAVATEAGELMSRTYRDIEKAMQWAMMRSTDIVVHRIDNTC